MVMKRPSLEKIEKLDNRHAVAKSALLVAMLQRFPVGSSVRVRLRPHHVRLTKGTVAEMSDMNPAKVHIRLLDKGSLATRAIHWRDVFDRA